MKKILLLSDTHSYIDEQILKHVKHADEVWHAGDIGTLEVTNKIKKHSKLRAVYGNIDGVELRREFPLDLHFEIEGVKVYITHIGGHSNKYNQRVKNLLEKTKPDVFICGHSHILKVAFNSKLNLLHMNPGAAGKYGAHLVRTLIRFNIDKGEVKNLEVIEFPKQ